jgi:hypothetical protein
LRTGDATAARRAMERDVAQGMQPIEVGLFGGSASIDSA